MKAYHHIALLLLLLIAQIASPQSIQVQWGEDVALTDFARDSWHPRVVSWGDAVYIVWYSNSQYMFERILTRSSFDRGETWNDQVRISPWGPEEVVFDVTPAIAVWQDSLYVVFREQNDSTLFIGTVFSASADSGQSWYDYPLELIEDSWHPAVSVWGSYVNMVCYSLGHIMHRLSMDGGVTFQPIDTLADIGDGNQPHCLRAHENYVFLAYRSTWDNTNTAEVFFQRSTNYGVTFEPYIMLSTEGMNHSQLPSMDITENGDVYVAWMDYKYSPYPTTGDILMRHSPDFGEHWGDEVQVTSNHYAVRNSVAAEGCQVHVVWQDGRWGNFSEEELYYRYSDDYGQNWSDEVRLTNAPHQSNGPDLCQKDDTLHLVWWDKRDSLWYQIYYKRGTISIIPGVEEEERTLAIDPAIALTTHPNPFNTSVTLLFTLPAPSCVVLNVFDIAGRAVGERQESWYGAGVHRILFDGSKLPSGIYIYRLSAGDFIASGKMLLLK